MDLRLQDAPGFRGHAQQPRALGGYATLMSVYGAVNAVAALAFHRSGRRVPERADAGDLALMTLAAHKLSRLITATASPRSCVHRSRSSRTTPGTAK